MDIRWVTAFLDHPASKHDAAVAFWAAATGSPLSNRCGEHGEFATLVPNDGDAYLRVQRVASGDGGVHLDLHVEDVTAFAWKAVSLGAKELHHEDELVVLTSPAGFAFCVVPWRGEATRPTPSPGVVDQVALDISPSDYDLEGSFWADLTQWELRRGSREEFVVLERPEGQPIRLLLQRLVDDRPGPVTAHLDLAAGAHVHDVVVRLSGLGARAMREEAHWVVMRDPGGLPFCVTERDPVTGTLG
jgi:hypothetical protein